MSNILEHAHQIAQSRNSLIYLSEKNEYGKPVIIKMLKHEFNSFPHIAQIVNENNLIHDVKINGVRNALEEVNIKGDHGIVLEYIEGKTIKELSAGKSINIKDALKIAINCCKILEDIHDQNIIHKDITSYNILINTKDLSANIIDFGIATSLKLQTEYQGNPERLEGTLQYISPEQTGRVNRPIDFNSDLYSLGVTLYELITGQLPFPNEDPMELIHAHLAVVPVPVNVLNPDVPQMLANITNKLLAKNSNDRYKSAIGVAADLQECLEQIEIGAELISFDLAKQDYSTKFYIPQKLFGREKEYQSLLSTFERVVDSGKPEIMMITGSSGTGKSALIKEIQKPITLQCGVFLSGKFEQYHQDVPYLAISQALDGLINLWLTEREEKLEVLKSTIENALGDELSLLLEIIPQLHLIVGQHATGQLIQSNINGIQHRFNYAFLRFIKLIAGKGKPLVFFIDDLQWADFASLNLLKVMLTNDELSHILFIGAYRNNETDDTHPLITTFDEIAKNESIITHHINLANLELKHVEDIVSETLLCSKEEGKDLSQEVFGKTHGNPFFINQFLHTLHDNKLLLLQRENEELSIYFTKPKWVWKLDKIKALDYTDNVIEMLSTNLKKLNSEAQEVLMMASCIGNRFDLKSLVYISDKPFNKIVMCLWVALKERLITPIGNNYSFIQAEPNNELLETYKFEYKFAHDRIQQATYSLIPEENKLQVHHKVGKLLLSKLNTEEKELQVFDLVFHLNKSINLLETDEVKKEVASLNLIAGKKAKNSSAYQTSLSFYERIPQLLGDENWDDDYAFTLNLYNSLTEASYLSGNYDKVDSYSQLIFKNSRTLLDQITAHQMIVHTYIAQNKPRKAIEKGLSVLRKLKVNFPSKPNKGHIVLGLIKTQLVLKNKKLADLENLPQMSNPEMLAAMNIIASFGSIAYRIIPELFPLVVFKLIQISIKYGNSLESIPTYGGYAIIQNGIIGNINAGYEFGQLSERLLDKYDSRNVRARTYIVLATFVRVWKEHIKETIPMLKQAYMAALELGDMEFAAASLMMHACHSFTMGESLHILKERSNSFRVKINNLNQEQILLHSEIFRQAILNFCEEVNEPGDLRGPAYDESVLVTNPEDEEFDGTTYFYAKYNKLILNFVFGNFYSGYLITLDLQGHLEKATSTVFFAQYHFYDSLSRLAYYPFASEKEKKSIIKKVKANQKKMLKWAAHAPMNFEHLYDLVDIELSHVEAKKNRNVEKEYQDVIEFALQHNYTNIAAIGSELAGKYFLSINNKISGEKHIISAYNFYSQWGADNKVNRLISTYPSILSEIGSNEKQLTISTTSRQFQHTLDLSSLIKATTAISKELRLENVGNSLLKILIENAGAQNGSFIIRQNGSLKIFAQIEKGKSTDIVEAEITEENNLAPISIINYASRSKEIVIIDDLATSDEFINDPYFRKSSTLSCVVNPVIHQDQVIGIIYLENNLITGAFTEQRLEMLKLLSGQIAVTVSNALLYQNLEKKVQERTAEIESHQEILKDKNKQLEEINEEKNQLLAVVSHDLRSPLNQIKGLARLIELSIDGSNSSSETKECTDQIISSSDRLNEMISRILNISAIEAQEIKLNVEKANLDELVKKVINSFSMETANKDISINFKANNDKGTVLIDVNYGFQVFSNILSNAIKFSDQGQAIEVNIFSEDHVLITEIKDNGPGISPGDQKKLFNKFQKLTAQPTAGEASTGLGLSIVKKYTEAMNGRIWCESQLEQGASFFLEFPIAD